MNKKTELATFDAFQNKLLKNSLRNSTHENILKVCPLQNSVILFY